MQECQDKTSPAVMIPFLTEAFIQQQQPEDGFQFTLQRFFSPSVWICLKQENVMLILGSTNTLCKISSFYNEQQSYLLWLAASADVWKKNYNSKLVNFFFKIIVLQSKQIKLWFLYSSIYCIDMPRNILICRISAPYFCKLE